MAASISGCGADPVGTSANSSATSTVAPARAHSAANSSVNSSIVSSPRSSRENAPSSPPASTTSLMNRWGSPTRVSYGAEHVDRRRHHHAAEIEDDRGDVHGCRTLPSRRDCSRGESRVGFLGLAAGVGRQRRRSARLTGAELSRLPTRALAARRPNRSASASLRATRYADRVMPLDPPRPDPQAPGGGMAPETFPVRWEVARRRALLEDRVATGKVHCATPSRAQRCTSTRSGLEPDREYFYRFLADGTGERGWPHPHRACRGLLAEAPAHGVRRRARTTRRGTSPPTGTSRTRIVDVVFWLGDYIYENGPGSGVRVHEGPEVMDVPAYRRRYGTYKADPDLQAVHAAHPWVVDVGRPRDRQQLRRRPRRSRRPPARSLPPAACSRLPGVVGAPTGAPAAARRARLQDLPQPRVR